MADTFTICWYDPKNGSYHYLTAYGVQSLKSHMDFFLGMGGRIVSVKNDSL